MHAWSVAHLSRLTWQITHDTWRSKLRKVVLLLRRHLSKQCFCGERGTSRQDWGCPRSLAASQRVAPGPGPTTCTTDTQQFTPGFCQDWKEPWFLEVFKVLVYKEDQTQNYDPERTYALFSLSHRFCWVNDMTLIFKNHDRNMKLNQICTIYYTAI